MTPTQHPVAIEHLPPFVTAPGETDVLFIVVALIVLLMVIGVGVFYFKLHALPEQLAHKGQKIQFEIVAVLGLLSLFTHNHSFWIAGLLLAIVPLPDFLTPMTSMSRSLDRLAQGSPDVAAPPPPAAPAPVGAHPAPAPAAPDSSAPHGS